MNHAAILQVGLFLAVLLVLAWPLSNYCAALFDGRRAARWRWLEAVERGVCRLAGADADQDMHWSRYASALLVFNVIGLVAVYLLQRVQGGLPFNPQDFAAVTPDSAFNTAISFVTNTNWQGYGGESTMSYLTQMLALAVQNFLSAATGIVVAVVLMRAFARRSASGLGNIWVDLSRATLGLLLPLSFLYALFLVGQGVIQNVDSYRLAQLTETVSYSVPVVDADGKPQTDAAGLPAMKTEQATTQLLAMGPVASQEAIKLLGTNGGGFFNANSAHPYENPTPLSNFSQMLAILLIPAALCLVFGRMIGDRRQGVAILAAMTVLFVLMAAAAFMAEGQLNPQLAGLDPGLGNMEGKEMRFGVIGTMLFAVVTTAASCGAVNAMHDALMPLGGLVPMLEMQLGEVIYGGVGSGFYGMLVFALVAVFVSGLMIGRTPEYLGKKIEAFEMKMLALAILIPPTLVLGGSAIAVVVEAGRAGMLNTGAHGFSEVLYAFTSAANNNGSAFAGLSANTPFYNVMLGMAMWFGRFGVIIPVLAIAGHLAAKPKLATTAGSLPTHGPLFVTLLVGTVLLVGALTFIPSLALGPIVDHLQLFR